MQVNSILNKKFFKNVNSILNDIEVYKLDNTLGLSPYGWHKTKVTQAITTENFKNNFKQTSQHQPDHHHHLDCASLLMTLARQSETISSDIATAQQPILAKCK